MRRGEIPGALLKARRADIGKIPDRVLAKLTRADLASRLLASGEYQRRARVPHLDADLYSYRLGLAREVLETDDPKRAAELVKGAGVSVTTGGGRPAVRPAVPARTAPLMLKLAKAAGSAAARHPTAASAGYAASEVAWQRSPAGQAMAKAVEYERKAYVVTDPEMRRGYLELAAQERQKTSSR